MTFFYKEILVDDFVRPHRTVINGCAYNEPNHVDDYPARLLQD